jgi:hypothetical protein
MRDRLLPFLVALLCWLNLHAFAQGSETEVFTTEDGSFTFEYPSGWQAEFRDADQIANASLTLYNLPLEELYDSSEGITIQISLPRKFYDFAFMTGNTPSEMVAQAVPGASPPMEVNFSTPSVDGTPQPLQIEHSSSAVREFMVDERPAAYAYSVMQVMDVDASQLFIIADLGDDYWVSISALSYKGGLETIQRYEPAILQMVQSMRYTPPPLAYSGNPDLPQVYSGVVGVWRRGSIQFYYPADWHVSNTITVAFSNRQQNLLNTLPESGQFIAALIGVSETISTVDQTELSNHCNNRSRVWTAREVVAEQLSNITQARLDQLENAGITFTQPEIVTVNGVEIVYMRQYQGEFEALSMVVDVGEGNVLGMSVTTRRGEMVQFEEQLFAVASTFQYTPRPCEEATAASDE